MEQVNWELDVTSWGDGLGNVHSESLVVNAVIAELATGRSVNGDYPAHQVVYHDSEVSNDQEEGVKRVLDDSPNKDWVEFFRFQTATENHKAFSKKQKDGATLIVINEAYPGATELPPLYLLVREGWG